MKNMVSGLAVMVLVLSMVACRGNETTESESSMSTVDEVRSELAELVNGNGRPNRELAGLAVAVLRDGEVAFEATFGRAYIDPSSENDRSLTTDNLMRIASISKTLSAIVVMQLVEEGTLELDRDVSEYLGWELRNPHYPGRAITLRHLLAHVSSIRDAGESYIIRYPHSLKEAFDPEGPDFGERFQIAEEGRDRGPGAFFEYCNLNYGVVGTILERVTGVRFDELMKRRFFAPLDLAGGFNVAAFSEIERSRLATLYRRGEDESTWNPEGPWVAQVDDLSEGIPTALPEGAEYVIGTNGAQFSPQGGARMSLHGLATLATLFVGDGAVGDLHLLTAESAEELRRQVWRYDPDKKNIEDYDGTINAWATGLRIITSETPGDRLFSGDDRVWYGHFGEAYGLLAGVLVHPESGDGVIYAITGTGFNPDSGDEPKSTLYPIEASVLEQLARLL